MKEVEEFQENEDIELTEELFENEEIEEDEYVEQEETEEYEEFEEVYESKKPIGKLITLVAFTAIMLVSSTYAWFTAQKNITIGNLEGKVNVAEGLEVSLDAKNWSHEIIFSDYSDQNDLKQLYGNTEHNIIPIEMLPVSTTGKEGIDQTDITMYRGINTDEIKLSTVEATSSSVTNVSDNKYPGYYAIDVFLRNSSRIRELDPDNPDDEYTEEDLYETLQLNADSMVNVKSGGLDSTGLQNTVRVALALYTSIESGDTARVDMTANQSQILAATTGASAKIKDVTIWEPNSSDHVDYVVINNNRIKWLATDKVGYIADQTNGKFTATEKVPTYALKSAATAITGDTQITDIYDWSGINSTYLEKQITLQTTKSADSYYVAEGVQNLISVNSTDTAIYPNSPTGSVTTFKIPKNQVCRLRMYIWLEGQDVDCINYASHGGGIEVDLGLIKSAEVGSGVVTEEPEEGAITQIALDKTAEEMTIGDTLDLTATINADATEDLTWVSSNPDVATVTENMVVATLRENGINSSVRVASVTENIENLLVASSTEKTISATITAISEGTAIITAKNTDGSISQSCTVTVAGGAGNATASGPYLPTGFSWANTEHTEILDPLNNQYVWISVPRDATVYNDLDDDTEDTAMSDASNEDILNFDVNNLTTANLTAIEKELHEYTATYRNGTTYKDEFYSTDQHGFADATAYNNHKNTMLASVFKNGGFYVGKYETGIADTDLENIDTNHEARTAKGDATQTPVIQANAYPYNFVTNKQAQELASTKFNGGGYTTSLMFGVQWDLVLKHLQVSNAASTAELNSNSTEWGNYTNNTTYSTNTKGKYYVSSWTDGAYNKTASGSVLLSTGASTEFERGGIYDLAGNVYEWTLEYTSITIVPCAGRGGYYGSDGRNYPASYRNGSGTTSASRSYGFRVALY